MFIFSAIANAEQTSLRANTVLFDQNGIKVTVTADPWLDYNIDRQFFYITATAENNTGGTVMVLLSNASINGVEADGYGISSVEPGTAKTGDMIILMKDDRVQELDQITDIGFSVQITTADFETLFESEVQTFTN